ncbi:protein kinase [Actinosynnema pretiosum subsp. pretiosum]|uniref:Serine/threonine-protein kinase PknG n=1 Tax=Actinosynnema pretiosum subsp. pretiosum TaxID=103721 RepID=A0AA45R5J1_9PSEU|nr:serine/threonine protein kinase [Actinosynnema pretiosum subsp. pretiosum]QUF05884.1 protein kinase [Actinosynnema pretiosum subsp. pretiosum]
MTACSHPGCGGTIEATGFCDTCGREARAPGRVHLTEGRRSRGASTSGTGREHLSLPVFSFPEPLSRVQENPRTRTRGRLCGNGGCSQEIGAGYAGQPALHEGYCPACGHFYSFLPALHRDDEVGGQYRVVGPLAQGGLGWVYLARDRRLDDNLVVLKGMISAGDTPLAEAERRALTAVDHPSIVRIVNFVTHRDRRSGQDRVYIVMEFVDGLVLQDVATGVALGERLRAEHVVTIGREVLSALGYLHGRGLVYCDMKPDNVILRPGRVGGGDSRVKVIDLGAVRRIGERVAIIGTKGFQVDAAEIAADGVTPRSDLHALGHTLRRLAAASADAVGDPGALRSGLESFGHALDRATHPDPARRFASAVDMDRQLDGVLREIASSRDGRQRPVVSELFEPTAALVDAGLGAVPPLSHWTEGVAETPLPSGRDCAGGLPSPRWDLDIDRLGDPNALLRALPDTAEANLLRAHALVGLGRTARARALLGVDVPVESGEDGTGRAEAVTRRAPAGSTAPGEGAESEFGAATWGARLAAAWGRVTGAHREAGLHRAQPDPPDPPAGPEPRARPDPLDWRVHWLLGLAALVDGVEAHPHFLRVHHEVPGETAPVLALGLCAEQRGDVAEAERRYRSVWARDRSQGSAAFGSARVRLAGGDPDGALDVLAQVPEVSRHREAAAVAAVKVLAGTGRGDEAVRALAALALDGDARDRLVAHVLDRVDPSGGSADRERAYRDLARQARTAAEHGVLVDLANEVRPRTTT